MAHLLSRGYVDGTMGGPMVLGPGSDLQVTEYNIHLFIHRHAAECHRHNRRVQTLAPHILIIPVIFIVLRPEASLTQSLVGCVVYFDSASTTAGW